MVDSLNINVKFSSLYYVSDLSWNAVKYVLMISYSCFIKIQQFLNDNIQGSISLRSKIQLKLASAKKKKDLLIHIHVKNMSSGIVGFNYSTTSLIMLLFLSSAVLCVGLVVWQVLSVWRQESYPPMPPVPDLN